MRDPDREIALQNPNRYPDVRVRRLRPWLERLLGELAPRAQSLGVRFCGDREMRRANRQYRGLDKTTDVLSFPGSPHPPYPPLPPLPPPSPGEGGAPLAAEGRRRPSPGVGGWRGGRGDGGEGSFHLGDVLISVPVARRQAGEAGHAVERELQILLLHGVLHCLGYDHETDQGQMARLERRLRRAWIAGGTPDSGAAHV